MWLTVGSTHSGCSLKMAFLLRSVLVNQCKWKVSIAVGGTMDVADWLRTLNLSRYEAAFRENSVGIDVLPSLTADDLKDLGVNAVGDRRRLLNAIAALRPGAEGVGAQNAQEALAERRQLTVMFCDVAGSTALSTRLDPEDLSAVVRTYQSTVRSTISRFGGFIARYVGDGVLIYFGWPEAHETDAESAVRAALAVIAAVSESSIHGEQLSIRIGIATGLVVVGSPIGEGDARQQTAIGETPNLAARLQSLAEPNAVVIAAGTRRLVGDLFEYRDLGAVDVKGIAEPVPAWQVLGQSVVASRFEALHASSLIPLVGRGEEIELLLRRWAQAKDGAGQVVLLSGEPGIGKSRIAAELQARLRAEPHISLSYFGSPHHRDTSTSPVHHSSRRCRRIFTRRFAGNETEEASGTVAVGRKSGRHVRGGGRFAQPADRRRPIGVCYRAATQTRADFRGAPGASQPTLAARVGINVV